MTDKFPYLAVEKYLARPYHWVLTPEDNGVHGEILEFPGCYADGVNLPECLHNLYEAAYAWLGASIEAGHGVPNPVDFIFIGKDLAFIGKDLGSGDDA